MLSVRNLVKIYKTKGGVDVHALDNVSLDFPETGMVFLLGKSGSGKSTLLNMIGGLDIPTSGEIIVKGKSSKDFSSVDFDSYRNTCIGFIFQEYNILNEFNVEQNIALALQLQGKKSDKTAVNELLKMVDLEGMGKRKPNTLSGGQKQRIAIARALIKDPEIIMADEPTGALDSKTGAQVLDTLKNLSKSKLVIIVSHDHEFAEKYGDRIIELKDGKIIKDNSKTFVSSKAISENVNFIGDKTVKINDVSSITEKDIKSIVEKMKEHGGEGIISFDSNDVQNVTSAHPDGRGLVNGIFSATDENEIKKKLKNYDGSETRFIKSKMPLRHSFRMGLTSLKTKPIRLIFTIFLSVIAFTLFGVVSTMMTYDPSYSVGVELQDSVYDNIAISKSYVEKSIRYEIQENGEKVKDYEWEQDKIGMFGVEELKTLNENGASLGVSYIGVYNDSRYNITESLSEFFSGNGYHISDVFGFSDCGSDYLTSNGYEFIGESKYPSNSNEVMISKFLAESIMAYGFKENESLVEINDIKELIGRKLSVKVESNFQVEFVITGIVDTKISEEYELFNPLSSQYALDKVEKDSDEWNELSAKEEMLSDCIGKSMHSILYVSEDFYHTIYKKDIDPYELKYISGDMFINCGGSQTPSLYYTVEDTLAENLDIASFYTFSEDFSSVSKEDNHEFSIEGTDVYLNVQDIGGILYPAYTLSSYLPDNVDKTNFENAYSKYKNTTESLTEADLNALFKYIRIILDEDFSNSYNQESQNGIKNKLYNLLMYDESGNSTPLQLKGLYILNVRTSPSPFSLSPAFISKSLATQYETTYSWVTENFTDYVQPTDAKYNYLVTKSQNTLKQTQFILDSNSETYFYAMANDIYESAQKMIRMIKEFTKLFLIVGGVFAGFAALMMLNFISVSISNKKKEIGVLRAVGARGVDVFKIFFSESSIIATLCVILSSLATYFACMVLNSYISGTRVGLSLLNFGALHVGIILVISFIVSLIATIILVHFAAKKPPVESIRAL